MPVEGWDLLPLEHLDLYFEQILEVESGYTGSEAAVTAGAFYLVESLDCVVWGQRLAGVVMTAEIEFQANMRG